MIIKYKEDEDGEEFQEELISAEFMWCKETRQFEVMTESTDGEVRQIPVKQIACIARNEEELRKIIE